MPGPAASLTIIVPAKAFPDVRCHGSICNEILYMLVQTMSYRPKWAPSWRFGNICRAWACTASLFSANTYALNDALIEVGEDSNAMQSMFECQDPRNFLPFTAMLQLLMVAVMNQMRACNQLRLAYVPRTSRSAAGSDTSEKTSHLRWSRVLLDPSP